MNTLRAALVLVAQRETTRQSRNTQHNAWYKFLYEQTKDHHLDYFDSRDTRRMADMKHGGLLVMAELFRASNRDWEMRYRQGVPNTLETCQPSWPLKLGTLNQEGPISH